MNKKKIRGPSRSRTSIRPRAVRAALTRHYEESLQDDPAEVIILATGRTAPARGR